MAVPARLTRALRGALGEEGGDDLVTWMVQVDANRSELRDMLDPWTARFEAKFAEVNSRFDRVDARFAEVDARFDRVDARFAQVDTHFAEVEKRMDVGFAGVNERMVALELRVADRIADLFKWSFVFWCGTVAAVVISAMWTARR